MPWQIIRVILLFSMFALSFYSISALRLEQFFRKNSKLQIQLFYLLSSMALAYLVTQYLLSLRILEVTV